MQPSAVKRRSISIAKHKTTISLEDEFWQSLRMIAIGRGETLSHLLAKIEGDRQTANLSSAIRLFVLRYYRDQLDQRGGIVSSLDLSNVTERGTQLGFNFERS
jgi:predicted DNA-binding ribbon-helix-helix protein